MNQPDVELRLPAEKAYVAVLRMTTAGIAARLDFTLDDIEDLRIAVGEACALVLDGAREGGSLHAAYTLGEGTMRVRVAVETMGKQLPDTDSFGWQVLTTLAGSVEAAATDDEHSVSLSVSSGALA